VLCLYSETDKCTPGHIARRCCSIVVDIIKDPSLKVLERDEYFSATSKSYDQSTRCVMLCFAALVDFV
jgi:hypothetical protein